jgi:hypothetical protein
MGKMKKMILLFCGGFLFSCEQSVYIAPQLPDTVSFKQHIIPLLNNNCNNSSCHGGSHPQAYLSLEASNAHQQLWDKELIDTVNPSHSAIYSSMTSAERPMPPSGRLDSFYVKLMLRWIEQGGMDN